MSEKVVDPEARRIIETERQVAIAKAWDNASRNKWENFGYWASRESFLRGLLGLPDSQPGPFREVRLLALAKTKGDRQEGSG